MLIGYVSDERYTALADVLLEFMRGEESVTVRSTPRGAVYADLTPGAYRVTLAKEGYGAKTVEVHVKQGEPYAFRLLSNRLLGYVWPKWVRSGERGEFRVHSVEAYRLSLVRYGWEKELVRLLGWYDEHGPRAVVQITPDGDYTQSGVQWNRQGYASAHHGQSVLAPERSGLYYFHAETEAGAFFAFPWVVAPAAPQASVAVLAATNNWNAYNNFGGRSNYINASGLPPTPIVNARQDLPRYAGGTYGEWQAPDDAYLPLSFDRPEPGNSLPRDARITDPIRGRDGCHQAPAEWRLLGWLEREGFAYDLYSETQLHNGTLELDAYRVLILGGHPEYWSETMYRRVKEWVYARGGRLMYLGGNGLNCAVEFPDSATMRCLSYLSSLDGSTGMTDPTDPTRRFDSRFHRCVEPEASLLGVTTTATGIMTAAPYRVIEDTHWIFTETGLRAGDTFGHANLHERCHGGASGHETDKRSLFSPPETVLLAKGLNPDEGGAEMVTYTTESGGAVFSVGSITYIASLPVDAPISRITRNVLEQFLKP
jgi:N,N-dimethylformamidase